MKDKQFMTELINHNKKQIEFFEGRKKKENIKNNTTLKTVEKTASLSITYWKKKTKEKNNKKT